MNTICRWVRGKDGALVMEWTEADYCAVEWDDSDVRAADGREAAYDFLELNRECDTLTPVGV
jgi:hypothetical protein